MLDWKTALGLSLSLDSDLSLGFAPAAIDTVFAMAADGMKFVLVAVFAVLAVAAAEAPATVDSLSEAGASVLVLAAALNYLARRIGSDLSFDSALD